MAASTGPAIQAQLGAVLALLNSGRPGEAEQQARLLLQLQPSDGLLWTALGVALARQGKDALPALRRCAELLPEDPEAHRNLATALVGQGQREEALRSLQRALALAPDQVDDLVEAGDLLRALGRAGEAMPYYRRALDRDRQSAAALNGLGNVLLADGRGEEAIERYHDALRLRPQDPQLLYNLGNGLRLLGRLDEALDTIQRSLAADPELGAAHDCRGAILRALGRSEEAVASFRRAAELAPRSVEARHQLAEALREIGSNDAALQCLREAIDLAPARPDSHWRLGSLLFELRRPREAISCYGTALRLQPDFAPALLGMATVLRQQHLPKEAEASCRAALAIMPDSADALSLLGELVADRGEFAEAEAMFQRAIDANPRFAFGYFSIATHRRMSHSDEGWVRGVTGLLAGKLPLRDEITLRYALGKYHNDIAQYDEAFDNYFRANELTKRLGARYDPAKFTRMIDEIIARFDAGFLQRYGATGSASDVPTFIIGMPRSGTSLMEQILASHPGVHGAGELRFWNGAYGRFRKGVNEGEATDAVLEEIGGECVSMLSQFAPTARRVIDKMPANFLYAGLIHAIFPNARLIHMRRHPFDTCLSIYFQNFLSMGPYSNDLGDLAHYYSEYERLMAHWRRVLPANALLDVPYEDLVTDQESWTRRVIDFLGLPWDPRCLDFHQTDRPVITASKWQVRQPISTSSTGRWRKYERHLGPLRGLVQA